MKKCNVAIMGLGTVGGGTARILQKNHDFILNNEDLDIQIVKVLELNPERATALGLGREQVASNIDEIAADPTIDTVVETMGGVEPARTFMLKCLSAGKNVVTANKECVAKHWAELERTAKEHGCGLYFEAACVGGVPVIRTLTDGCQANRIHEIMGIFNGTTNYILSEMTEKGTDYAVALSEAQRLGFAELNPSSDVNGHDTVYKLSILASLAFHTSIPHTLISREGISKITPSDIEAARELGFTIKLLAIGRRDGNRIDVRVQPAFVPNEHPLAAVSGSFNAMFIRGDMVGDIMLYGRGAGDLPTGSAIVSDIVYSAKLCQPHCSALNNTGVLDSKIEIVKDYQSKFYFSVECPDASGILGKMTTILGRYGVSLESCLQRASHGPQAQKNTATVIFLSHLCCADSLKAALSEMTEFATVKSLIHVV